MAKSSVSEQKIPTALARIGITSPREALLVAPVSYTNYTVPIAVLPVPDQDEPTFIRVLLKDLIGIDKDGGIVEVSSGLARMVKGDVLDELGNEANFVAFQALRAWKEVQPGQDIHLYGRLSVRGRKRVFYDVLLVRAELVGKVLPVYAGKPGIASADTVALGVAAAHEAVQQAADLLMERTGLSRDSFARACALTPEELLQGLHWPRSMREATISLAAARKVSIRGVYERVRLLREGVNDPKSALGMTVDGAIERVQGFLERLPFQLTKDQRRAIWEILQDLVSETVMRRMLSGDVGTGKSVVFLTIAALVVDAGKSVAVIAPNGLLVEQLADELGSYYPEVHRAIVVSGRKAPREAFSRPGVFFGTTALLNAAQAEGKSFFMVVSDEQQKFSVDQREALLDLGGNLLESTATAIPRSVALVAMGGIDVSILRQSPVEKTIKSRLVTPAQQRDLIEFVKRQVKRGFQVAIIYPQVEKGGKRSVGADGRDRSLMAAATRFAKLFGDRVGVLHGKLAKTEKKPVLDKMLAGELDLLVASSIIEIGVTLPSLRVVVVVNPEYFGVSQLHQLRGRLARKGGVGFFFMLDAEGSLKGDSLARMKLLEECSDGFALAERDAAARGAGEVFRDYGKQSGDTSSLFFGINLTYNEVEQAAMDAMFGRQKPAQGGLPIAAVVV